MTTRTNRPHNDATPSASKRVALSEPLGVLSCIQFFQRATLSDAAFALQFASAVVAQRGNVTKESIPPSAAEGSDPQRTPMRVLVEDVLRDSDRPMKATEINEAIAEHYGQAKNIGSINAVLAKLAKSRTVKRVSAGRYALAKAAAQDPAPAPDRLTPGRNP